MPLFYSLVIMTARDPRDYTALTALALPSRRRGSRPYTEGCGSRPQPGPTVSYSNPKMNVQQKPNPRLKPEHQTNPNQSLPTHPRLRQIHGLVFRLLSALNSSAT